MDTLDQAISTLRSRVDADSTLSPAAKGRIVSACWDDREEAVETFQPAFRPGFWLRAFAVAPLLLAAVAIVSFRPGQDPGQPEFVAAMRSGDEVVFTVQDGPGPHTVLKSTDPLRFNPAARTVVADGKFADRAQSGPVIVYYRID